MKIAGYPVKISSMATMRSKHNRDAWYISARAAATLYEEHRERIYGIGLRFYCSGEPRCICDACVFKRCTY